MYKRQREELVTPMEPMILETSDEELRTLFCKDTFKEDYKILNTEIRKLGYNIPPLVNAYMSLSPTMRMFGTAINYEFGDVEETGILIAVDEILEDKRIRHIQTFIAVSYTHLDVYKRQRLFMRISSAPSKRNEKPRSLSSKWWEDTPRSARIASVSYTHLFIACNLQFLIVAPRLIRCCLLQIIICCQLNISFKTSLSSKWCFTPLIS